MNTRKLWVARDKDADFLIVFYNKPERINGKQFIDGESMMGEHWLCCLPGHVFPEITWENSPQEIEIKLK